MVDSGTAYNRASFSLWVGLVVIAVSFRTPVLGLCLAGGLLVLHVAMATAANRLVLLSVPFLATALCFWGGIFSPSLIVAGGLLLCSVARPEKPMPFPRLLLLMGAWISAEAVAEAFRFADTPFSLSEWVLQSPRLCRQIELATSFLLLNEVARRPSAIKSCEKWIFPALTVVLAVVAAQFLFLAKFSGVPDFFGFGLTPFFSQQFRVSGTFVDPNSAGAALAIVAGYLVNMHRWASKWVWFGLVLAAILLTGSRSGLMLVGALAAAVIVTRCCEANTREQKSLLAGFLLTVAGMSFACLLAVNTAPISVVESMPPGIVRVSKSMRYDTVHSALFSRTALWRVAFAEWTHAPLFGVGLDRYRELLPPFAQALDLSIGAWNDNPGSWPVFLLVELGLIGVLVFALDVQQLKVVAGAGPFLFALSVALLVGCHTHAPLVAILYGTVIAFGAERRGKQRLGISYSGAGTVLAAAPFIALIALWFPRGLYLWEMRDGILVRWTGSDAVVSATCRNDGILITPLAPPSINQKVLVSDRKLQRTIDAKSTTPLVSLDCVGPDRDSQKSQIHLKISPTWIPKDHDIGDDPRSLGVLLEYRQPIDLDGV